MDSQHRHELEENDLAHWLEREINKTKPYAPALLVGFLALVGGTLGWSAWQDSTHKAEAEAWRGFTLAVEGVRPNLDALQTAIDKHPDTPVETWARITWADGRLWTAAQEYLRNKGKATTALAEAEEAYQTLLAAGEIDIVDRARFGLARLHEMRGDLDQAKEHYQAVQGAFATISQERAEQLTTERLVADYAWITQTEAAVAEETAPAPEEDATTTLDDILRETIDASDQADPPAETDTPSAE